MFFYRPTYPIFFSDHYRKHTIFFLALCSRELNILGAIYNVSGEWRSEYLSDQHGHAPASIFHAIMVSFTSYSHSATLVCRDAQRPGCPAARGLPAGHRGNNLGPLSPSNAEASFVQSTLGHKVYYMTFSKQ